MTTEKRSIKARGEDLRILVVDDDDIVFRAIERALHKSNIENPVLRAKDGLEGLAILRGEIESHISLPPFVVLLDINMPRMDGIGFLKELRADPALRPAIVFVLSTSDAPADVCAAYNCNVAGYILKDELSANFMKTITLLDIYSDAVTMPPIDDIGCQALALSN